MKLKGKGKKRREKMKEKHFLYTLKDPSTKDHPQQTRTPCIFHLLICDRNKLTTSSQDQNVYQVLYLSHFSLVYI